MLNEPLVPGLRDRLLRLRRVNTFGRLSEHAMLMLAEHAGVRRYAADDLVLEEGNGVEHVHIVVSGSIDVTAYGQHVTDVGAGGAVGIVSLMAQDPHGVTAVATEPTQTLAIPLDVIMDIFEESYSFLRAGLRISCGTILGRDGHQFLVLGEDGHDERAPDRELSDIERVIELSENGLLSGWNVNAIFDIARTVSEVRLAEGEALWHKGDPPAAAFHVISGAIACDDSDCTAGAARRSGMIGLLESLSERPRMHTAVARKHCRLLRIELEDLLGALNTHRDMALEIIAVISRKLLPGGGTGS